MTNKNGKYLIEGDKGKWEVVIGLEVQPVFWLQK